MKLFLPVVTFCLSPVLPAIGANITWIGVNADWVDGTGNNANWNPADEPDADDTAIFNLANSVNLGSSNAILALTLSTGIDLRTNGFDLDVNGLVQLAGTSTNLIVDTVDSLLSADAITINNLATLELDGGTVQVNEESGDGILTVNAGGTLGGNGVVSMTDALAAVTPLIFNEGSIVARNPPALILTAPAAATLQFNATSASARLDLDGAAETGAVTVSRNQTLDINIPLTDIFNGSLTMTHNSRLDIASAWILGAAGTIDIDNGATAGLGAIPAGVATIAGSTFSQNSGIITVADADGTLQFDAPFTLNGGSLVNNGLVVFNSSTTIAAAANITMPTATSSLTVAAARTVNINQTNFNLDGANAATNVINVNENAHLNITTGDYDPDSATNAFDGTVNLTSGTISINTADAEFVMDGVLTCVGSGGAQNLWTGEPLAIGNDAGLLDAKVNIKGPQPTQFGTPVRFNSDASLTVEDGGTAHFLSAVNFNSVSGNNASFSGGGEIIFSAGVNVNEATTLNMVGGTIDLDGADGVGDTLNLDAPLTINAELLRSFGKTNGGGGVNLLNINNNPGTGTLTVNLDGVDDKWTLNAQGVINLVNDATAATLLAGSDISLNGTLNVTGDARTTARIDFGPTATVNLLTAGEPLRLAGGDNDADPNTISGATINGPGLLGADAGKTLRGFGTINAGVDFDGNAKLQADNGTLIINGALVDVDQIGTADGDGVLQVTNAWNNNVSTGVQLRGGTLSGGAMTNDVTAGISGFGTVTARVINNTQLFASLGDTLTFKTAANNNDWDGTTGTGEIKATFADIVMDSTGAAFGFTGSVTAGSGHRVLAKGFALDFNPGSTLTLATGGIYESESSTDLGGVVNIGAGGATLKVTNNFFLTFESTSATTLTGDLTLLNNNIIVEAGATFSGNGALILPSGNHLLFEPNANANVLLVNKGNLRPGGFDTVGRVDLRDYQQTATGTLFSEMTGTNLNQFDRLVVNGTAQLAGELSLDIDGGFIPVAGQTFDLITATGGISGHFNQVTFSGLPAGVTFQVTYGATFVRATVVAGTQYDLWINSFASLTNPADRLKTADPDKDGVPNYVEFALAGDPTSGGSMGNFYPRVASVNGTPYFTLTFPTRFPAVSLGVAPPKVVDTESLYQCFVEAGDHTGLFNANPVWVDTGSAAIQSGLPPLPDGWTYITFRSPTVFATDSREFIRPRFTE